MSLPEKSKYLEALSQKKDFESLKKQGQQIDHLWLRAYFLNDKKVKGLKVAWSLSKKQIPRAVIRNRFKRWGRENLKQTTLKGLVLLVFSKKDKEFFKNLKRKDFDNVFHGVLQKMSSGA